MVLWKAEHVALKNLRTTISTFSMHIKSVEFDKKLLLDETEADPKQINLKLNKVQKRMWCHIPTFS